MVPSNDKSPQNYFGEISPGIRHNAIHWLQKKCMEQAKTLPYSFETRGEWEGFKAEIRAKLPALIGIPEFAPMGEPFVRARFQIGEDVQGELVDVSVDEDYSIPCYVYSPLNAPLEKRPALLFSPGYRQGKWEKSFQVFAARMAKQGFVVLVLDHAPFGETATLDHEIPTNMSLVMELCELLGYSQMGLRVAEDLRCGEYLRQRPDVDENRIAISGLCQGGMDAWFAAALDDGFCAVAPICAASTFAVHASEQASYRANADSSPFPHGILRLCDVEHLFGCFAPRPVLVRANLGDDWWPMSGYHNLEDMTRKIYRLYDAEDKVNFRVEINEHDLSNQFADALEGFLLSEVK